MDQRLRQAAQEGNIEAFYVLVRENPHLLEDVETPFTETPLHVAASLGHTEFALEMMRLKPSFARKLNQDGFSPLHLALQNENNSELVISLLRVKPDLVRVDGREGETPLHYVTGKGNLHLLAKFLLVCPESINDVTIRSETALHIALKFNMVEAFQLLLKWLQLGSRVSEEDVDFNETAVRNCNNEGYIGLPKSISKKTVLNWKNNEGNTVLHIATSNNIPQVSSRNPTRSYLA